MDLLNARILRSILPIFVCYMVSINCNWIVDSVTNQDSSSLELTMPQSLLRLSRELVEKFAQWL
jgi:hypothetical protein